MLDERAGGTLPVAVGATDGAKTPVGATLCRLESGNTAEGEGQIKGCCGEHQGIGYS